MRSRRRSACVLAVGAVLASLSLSCSGHDEGPGVDVGPADLVGVWRRQDAGFTNNGKEYIADGIGYLGNFSTGSFQQATLIGWTLSNRVITEVWPTETHHEEIVAFGGTTMALRRAEDGVVRNWLRIQ